MLNPITASRHIQEEFTDYVLTLKPLTDPVYTEQFKNALLQTDAVAKGPYLEITDLYKTGKSLQELIEEGEASSLFSSLEHIAEDGKKELQIHRPLYLHQEEALRKVNQGKNLIVTTGTGSGKTECFMIPILNALLREEEQGPLESGTRAILIYPMNALANDQMKRLRALLNDHPTITFGVYNGSTPRSQEAALAEYQRTHQNPDGSSASPLPNEMISREAMQADPPHILVTNYAMLEYMMLRPEDQNIFSQSQLQFLVLDEAHVYKGATGIETSLLLSRLKARISDPEKVIHILTSATLGGPAENDAIVHFGEVLCNSSFDAQDIVRSTTQAPVFTSQPLPIPPSLFSKLNTGRSELEVLQEEGYSLEPREDGTIDVMSYLYDLCLNSTLYRSLRKYAHTAKPVTALAKEIGRDLLLTEQELVDFIAVASRVTKNKKPLMKARYHTFVKALEGAYVTLGAVKKLSLQRQVETEAEGQTWRYFEACVCSDCGRLGVIGEPKNGYLSLATNPAARTFFLITNPDAEDYEGEASTTDGRIGKDDFLLCPHCGRLIHASQKRQANCGHDLKEYIPLHRVATSGLSGRHQCPACPQGTLNAFYLGYDAATSVLATSLLEELPEKEVVFKPIQEASSGKKNVFQKKKVKSRPELINKTRQFLAFSDSRSEAAYFASYMEKHYQEFLRRRGIWHVIEHETPPTPDGWDIDTFVRLLSAYFDENRTFARENDSPDKNLTEISQRQAWIAVLQEMVNSRNSSSLTSMGLIRFHFKGNEPEVMESVKEAEEYGMTHMDLERVTDLFDHLAFDIVHNKAILSGHNLTSDEREYIYYTANPYSIKERKNAEDDAGKRFITSWLPYTNKKGYEAQNSRVRILKEKLGLSKETAKELLELYWENVLTEDDWLTKPQDGCRSILTSAFTIAPVHPQHPSWICSNCGKVTPWNIDGRCSRARCNGQLLPYTYEESLEHNHYAKLYHSPLMKPFFIKEHTAQLGRDEAGNYQDMFVHKKLNALSCSTTFEMGVDVGDLETVYLRNVPPTPANYVQRAGRAGRSLNSAAFSLTYAKLSSHDFTYFNHPEDMIMGKISVPVFAVENEKIIRRHIYAITFSAFFRKYPGMYNFNDANQFLNHGGFALLQHYLKEYPDDLDMAIKQSIPSELHERLGILDHSWTEGLIGPEGVLRISVENYENNIQWFEDAIQKAASAGKYDQASVLTRKLKLLRKSDEDKQEDPKLRGKNELIDFLVRGNVLPKYGFPVDTVSLKQGGTGFGNGEIKELNLVRDLQLAISEYAPGSKVIADNKMYTSRYIRKPITATDSTWETYYIAQCPSCGNWNYSVVKPERGEDAQEHICDFCQSNIPNKNWSSAIEPRMGFEADPHPEDVPMTKPEKIYRSDDYYIGDIQRRVIENVTFQSDRGETISLSSSANDSLMVVCEDDFMVCHKCGYSLSRSKNLTSRDRTRMIGGKLIMKHKNTLGHDCDGDLYRHKLCHIFKTDVVQIEITTRMMVSYDMVLSAMYAILEAAARVLDIERNDIKGCLHQSTGSGYSMVLYDAVAGGAGHVRRIVSKDGKVLRQIIKEALHITQDCTCSPSCYNCLRSYYNQQVHDQLDRQKAAQLLRCFSGTLRLSDI